ncbi:MAG TPA: hypothetical protein VMV27_03315 [Candidatus Binataceae bacterium]|nr:hypothetical protein [Candidatus Binataceae bacterium]
MAISALVVGFVGAFFGWPLLARRDGRASDKAASGSTELRVISASCKYTAPIGWLQVEFVNPTRQPLSGVFKVTVQEYDKSDTLFASAFAFLTPSLALPEMEPNERRSFRWPLGTASGGAVPAYVRIAVLPEMIVRIGGIPSVDWNYAHPIQLAGVTKIACVTSSPPVKPILISRARPTPRPTRTATPEERASAATRTAAERYRAEQKERDKEFHGAWYGHTFSARIAQNFMEAARLSCAALKNSPGGDLRAYYSCVCEDIERTCSAANQPCGPVVSPGLATGSGLMNGWAGYSLKTESCWYDKPLAQRLQKAQRDVYVAAMEEALQGLRAEYAHFGNIENQHRMLVADMISDYSAAPGADRALVVEWSSELAPLMRLPTPPTWKEAQMHSVADR